MNAENKNSLTVSKNISLRIIAKITEGMTIEQAYDFVLGEGTFKDLAEEIYGRFAGN